MIPHTLFHFHLCCKVLEGSPSSPTSLHTYSSENEFHKSLQFSIRFLNFSIIMSDCLGFYEETSNQQGEIERTGICFSFGSPGFNLKAAVDVTSSNFINYDFLAFQFQLKHIIFIHEFLAANNFAMISQMSQIYKPLGIAPPPTGWIHFFRVFLAPLFALCLL